MHTYQADDPALQYAGALSMAAIDGGLRPRRLRKEALAQVPTSLMRLTVDSAAGVRLRFRTSATSITLRVKVHEISLEPGRIFAAVVDLVVDGALVRSQPVHGTPARLDVDADLLCIGHGMAQDLRFGDLRPGEKAIELWLPHTAVVDVISVTADDLIQRAPEALGPRWIHHGSSISHCLEASSPTRTWPAVAAAALGYELTNLGFAGNAMLDPFVARTIRDEPADLISLKLGINLVNADAMRMRAFAPAVHGCLDTIREGHPYTPLIVISPIACPAVETRPGPTVQNSDGQFVSRATPPFAEGALTLASIRQVLAQIVRSRAASDAFLYFMDGRSLFGFPDVAHGRLPDGLHPDDMGYRLMGQRFAALQRRLFPTLRRSSEARTHVGPGV